ncbi:hypothetical protein V7137_13430 [Neobacillus drentensis]
MVTHLWTVQSILGKKPGMVDILSGIGKLGASSKMLLSWIHVWRKYSIGETPTDFLKEWAR